MASFSEQMNFEGKSVDHCYKAALRAIEKGGYKIFKKRDIGWLVVANGQLMGKAVSCNASARIGNPCAVTFSLSAEDLGEDDLKVETARLLEILRLEVGQG